MSESNNGSKSDIIALSKVSKTFWRGKERLDVLQELNLTMKEGSFEALMGPSGSGKSTLLNLIAGLDVPSSGSLKVAGVELSQMSEGDRAGFRAQNIGFVFQTYNLLPVLTALENVELPLLLAKLPAAERRKRAQTALRVVGLEDPHGPLPAAALGGQEQRVTIARAIVSDPKIIVADEPPRSGSRGCQRDPQFAGQAQQRVQQDHRHGDARPPAAERASICHRLDKGALAL